MTNICTFSLVLSCFLGLNLIADTTTFPVNTLYPNQCTSKCASYGTTWTGQTTPLNPVIPTINVLCECNNPSPDKTAATVKKATQMAQAIKNDPSTTAKQKSTLDQIIDNVKVAAEVAGNLKAAAEGVEKIKKLYQEHFGKSGDEETTEEIQNVETVEEEEPLLEDLL